MEGVTILHGDCREQLLTLPDQSVQCVVTSPPYYGLRKYSDDAREIGQEATPALYVAALVEVFRQVRRVLRDDGTVWLNLGDSYVSNPGDGHGYKDGRSNRSERKAFTGRVGGIKPKDLIGIPWRVAFALQDDGWYLRSDVIEEVELYCPCGCGHVMEERVWRYGQDREIIWKKPNCMPESVTDRPTRSHEYLFLLTKRARYFYDADAIREAGAGRLDVGRMDYPGRIGESGWKHQDKDAANGRNKRTVWTIATQPYSGAHYATMPEALIEPCVLAGSSAQACEHCGAAWGRVVERGMPSPDSDRPQQRRAAELWIEKGLTDEHLIALRAVGMADAGKAQVTMTGYGKNTPEAQRLADEAKAALGGYLREFLTGASSTTGFAPRCACPANTGSGRSVVLDPFGGSGTVAKVALRYQRHAVLCELNQAYIDDHIETRTDGVQIELFP